MNETDYTVLLEKTNYLGNNLRNWIKDMRISGQIIHDGDCFEILPPLPDDYIQKGKAKINISLHQEPFNNIKHYHNFYEIIYVYKGNITNVINDNEIELLENECVIQYPKVKHLITNFNSKDSIVINITLDKTFFDTFYYKTIFETNRFFDENEADGLGYVICKNQNKIVKKIIDIILYMFLSEDKHSDSSYENVLMLLLMELLKNNNNGDDFINNLYSYIISHISTVSLNNCASHFGYHPKYFCSLIKEKIGKTFKEIIIEKKIEKATYYLLHTNYSISKISELIGYENSLSFYTNFKRKYGLSPTEYKKSKRIK